MLLGNYSIFNRNTGTLAATSFTNPMARFKATAMPRFALGDQVVTNETIKAAWPNGYAIEPPGGSCWWPAMKSGGLGAIGTVSGAGTVAAGLSMGRALAASMSGAGAIAASLKSVVGMVGALSGSGSVSAALVGSTALAAALGGTGSLSAALGALSGMVAALSGSGSVAADLRGRLWMEAGITPLTELSPEALAVAVWSAVAASNDAAGTMGEKLNDAGSASNPWTEVIEGTYTAAELLRIMSAALAGELSGAGTTTITIKGVDGATDRITATVTTDGDRTALTLDGA